MSAGKEIVMKKGVSIQKYSLKWVQARFMISIIGSLLIIWVVLFLVPASNDLEALVIILGLMNIFFITPAVAIILHVFDYHAYSQFEYNNYEMVFKSPPKLLRRSTLIYHISYEDITRIFLDFNCSYAIILRDNSRLEVALKVIASHSNEMMFLDSINLLYQFHSSQQGARVFYDPHSHLYTKDILVKSMRGKPGRVFFALQ